VSLLLVDVAVIGGGVLLGRWLIRSLRARAAAATPANAPAGDAPPKPAKARPAPRTKPPAVITTSSSAAARTSPAARRRSWISLARLRKRMVARPAPTAIFSATGAGQTQRIAPASSGRTSASAPNRL